MNYSRLARAMDTHVSFFYDICFAWPLRRCSICGRLMVPGHEGEFYHPVIQERPALVCTDHFYSSLKDTDYDCLTGLEVKLTKPSSFHRKMLSNFLVDLKYFSGVVFKYIWFTITDWFMYITHPIKFAKMIKFYKKHGIEWK